MPLNDQKANVKLPTTLANKYSIFLLPSKGGIQTPDIKLHGFIRLFMLCGYILEDSSKSYLNKTKTRSWRAGKVDIH